MSEPLIHVDEVIAGYVPGVPILNGANLELADGELIGIIGPNGAGKSTMLKALFGLIKVTEGKVWYRGEDVTGEKANFLVARGTSRRSTTCSRRSRFARTSRWVATSASQVSPP